tara:strand:+ start:4119 stop:5411 length:1293 start_codon:yes stop_codon:yes gene_type:complete
MIHNVTPRRANIGHLIKYMLRDGHGHEHDLNLIKWIGSTTFAQDPIVRDQLTGLPLAEQPEGALDELIQEFEVQGALHKGKAVNLYAHYIISQSPDDRKLTQAEWWELITAYLGALGYDNCTKAIFVEHSDKLHCHAHIATSVVRADGSIIDNTDDVNKAFSVLRMYEKKFGLKQLLSPDQNWGKHYSKGEIKAAGGSREEAMSKDWAAIIRARFNAIESENGGKLPNTMTKLIIALANKSIEVKARQDDEGNITGLSFKADDGPFISASNIKKTRLTFKNIQVKEGVSYVPERDNAAFGIGNNIFKFNAAVQITDEQYKRIKVLKPNLKVFKRNKKRYASFCYYDSVRARQVAKMIENVMEILRLLFEELSGIDLDEELVYYYSTQEVLEYEYENIKQNEYNLIDTDTTFNEMKYDHGWITESELDLIF